MIDIKRVSGKSRRTSPLRLNGSSAKKVDYFIKGPIPLNWLAKASALGGKGPLAVGLVVWFLAGLKKTRSELKLTTKNLLRLGVNRKLAYRGVKKLEQAGLLRVTRKHGSSPVVSILDVVEEDTLNTPPPTVESQN